MLWWGGLRGSVGLALALVVFGTIGAMEKRDAAELILLHTAAIVIASVVFNGSTMSKLLHYLKLDTFTDEEQVSLQYAKSALWKSTAVKLKALRADPFMRGAEWNIVNDYVYLDDTHQQTDKSESVRSYHSSIDMVDDDDLFRHQSMHQDAMLARKQEDTYEATVRRFLYLEKRCYWEQFSQGVLGRNAVRILTEECDKAIDSDSCRRVTFEQVAAHMNVPSYYRRFKNVPYLGKRFKKQLFKKLFLAFHIGRGYIVAQERVQRYAKGTEKMRRQSVAANAVSSPKLNQDSKRKSVDVAGGRMWNKVRFSMATSVVSKGVKAFSRTSSTEFFDVRQKNSLTSDMLPSKLLKESRRRCAGCLIK